MQDQWDHVKVGDLVLGKRQPRLQVQGKIKEIKDAHRGKELLVRWRDGVEDWVKTGHLWLVQPQDGLDSDESSLGIGDGGRDHRNWDTDSTLSDSDTSDSKDSDDVSGNQAHEGAGTNHGQFQGGRGPGQGRGRGRGGRGGGRNGNGGRGGRGGRGLMGQGNQVQNGIGGANMPAQGGIPAHEAPHDEEEQEENLLHVRTSPPNREPVTYQVWTEQEYVNLVNNGPPVYPYRTKLVWDLVPHQYANDHVVKDPYSYFKLFFPMQYLQEIVNNTNEQITLLRYGTLIDKCHILRYLGIRLAIALNPTYGDLKSYWSQDDPTVNRKTVLEIKDFGKKYGISWKEFDKINSCFRLAAFTNSVNEVSCYNYVYIF